MDEEYKVKMDESLVKIIMLIGAKHEDLSFKQVFEISETVLDLFLEADKNRRELESIAKEKART